MDTVTGCDIDRNMIIKEIDFPLEYSNIQFDFTNIGSVLGAIVDTIGTLTISLSQGMIASAMKEFIGAEVPSLFCNHLAVNSTSAAEAKSVFPKVEE